MTEKYSKVSADIKTMSPVEKYNKRHW